MSRKIAYLAILLMGVVLLHPAKAQEPIAAAATAAGVTNEPDRQLKINREMLFRGTSEQIRIDAAMVMLFSEDVQARAVLFESLTQSENAAAKGAVCRALSQSRTTGKAIAGKEDFIPPLIGMLSSESGPGAKLAADALLIFEYRQIAEPLEKIAFDPGLPVSARFNAIEALKVQPDMRAIFKLMELTDDYQEQVAYEAEQALRSLAIPIGRDAQAKSQIISQLRRDGIVKFQRDRLTQQEARMRELQEKTDFWRSQYLASLNKIYESIADDSEKGKFLSQYLSSPEVSLRLWSLDKVYEARIGTKFKFPSELGPLLVKLVSDGDREVRLKTARLLSLMGEVNSAAQLLEQLKVEQDAEAATELFVALGQACYYAFLPNSKISISADIRKQTLDMASKYVADNDFKKAQRGIEVIRKLLEQNGLTSAEAEKYLGLLISRYNEQKSNSDGALRGELLNAMAGICAQSVYKADAIKLFRPLFEESLRDKTDTVREAAVTGLVNIDKTRALSRLRQELVNDGSSKVREKMISLASDVGGKEDLAWLVEKVSPGTEGEAAWQAMLTILRRSDEAVVSEWIGRFAKEAEGVKLSDEQRLAFFEIAEQKIAGGKNSENILTVRQVLAGLYDKSGDYKRASEYYSLVLKETRDDNERRQILAKLLNVYLGDGNTQMACQLLGNYLLEHDLDANSVLVSSLNGYLNGQGQIADESQALLKALNDIKADGRPGWSEQLQKWANALGSPKEIK